MLPLLSILMASSLAILVAPQSRPEDYREDILYSARNPKYHLICEFHGGRTATPMGYAVDSIVDVVIRNEQTGEAATFRPQRSEGDFKDFSFHNVWSPDGEWLVLSLGLQSGFQIIKASDVFEELKLPKPKQFLRLKSRKFKYEFGLFHEFLGWELPSSFNFDVSGDQHTKSIYRFNLEEFKLYPIFLGEGAADTYITSEGEHAIPVHPMITGPRQTKTPRPK